MARPPVAAGTLVIWGDIACPWATLAVFRLHRIRARLDLQARVRFDLRAFCLELVNGRPTPKSVLDSEVPVVAALEPDAGWRMWQAPESQYPVSTFTALAAVEAAKAQGLPASERLDLALRRALFSESRCISILPIVEEVAGAADLDVAALRQELSSGRPFTAVLRQHSERDSWGVTGSPHLFLPDGHSVFNPGIEDRAVGDDREHFVVVDSDDPSVYTDLLRRAAG